LHGGRKLAAEYVETVAKTGGEHLIDFDYAKKSQKVSCCKNLFLYLIIIMMTAYAINHVLARINEKY
jgi:hypothetical protein